MEITRHSRLFIDTIRVSVNGYSYFESVEKIKTKFKIFTQQYENILNDESKNVLDMRSFTFVSTYFYAKVKQNGIIDIETSQNRLSKYYNMERDLLDNRYLCYYDFISFFNIFGEIESIRRVDYAYDIESTDDLSFLARIIDRPRTKDKVYYYKTAGSVLRFGKEGRILIRCYNKNLEQKILSDKNIYRIELQLVGKNANILFKAIHSSRLLKRYFKYLWKYLNLETKGTFKYPNTLETLIIEHSGMEVEEIYEMLKTKSKKNWRRQWDKYLKHDKKFIDYKKIIDSLKSAYLGVEYGRL